MTDTARKRNLWKGITEQAETNQEKVKSEWEFKVLKTKGLLTGFLNLFHVVEGDETLSELASGICRR